MVYIARRFVQVRRPGRIQPGTGTGLPSPRPPSAWTPDAFAGAAAAWLRCIRELGLSVLLSLSAGDLGN